MEYIVYNCIQDRLQKLASILALEYGIPEESAMRLLEPGGAWHTLGDRDETEPPPFDKQCTARIWNGGYGGRCSRSSVDGSEFCWTHGSLKFPRLCRGCKVDHGENRYHNYVWEHFGKWDDPLPKCMQDTN